MSTKSKISICGRILAIASLILSIAILLFSLSQSSPIRCCATDSELPSSSDLSVSHTDTVSKTDIAPQEESPDCATLMFGGDILIHKSVYTQAKTGSNTYDFTPYVELFQDVFVADYNSVNLETPVDIYGDNESISTYPCFNAPLELLDAIKGMNIDLCTNSNNHMIDYGYKGLLATIAHLDSYGFDRLGTYASQEEHDALFIREINGIKVGFVAYTQTTNGIKLSESKESYAFDRMGMTVSTVDDILPQVTALRQAGAEIVIAVLHWGTEYNSYPSTAQTKIAYALCEGGVDIIMGSHPHVVQPIERLTFTNEDGSDRNCLVVYSLGNLLCNQSTQSEYTQRGMVVAIRLERGEDGIARFTSAFYMPTLLQVTRLGGADFMRLVPSGKYMDTENIPEPLAADTSFQQRCAKAYNHVLKIAGDAIPAVTSPEKYPEGFFSEAAEQ